MCLTREILWRAKPFWRVACSREICMSIKTLKVKYIHSVPSIYHVILLLIVAEKCDLTRVIVPILSLRPYLPSNSLNFKSRDPLPNLCNTQTWSLLNLNQKLNKQKSFLLLWKKWYLTDFSLIETKNYTLK